MSKLRERIAANRTARERKMVEVKEWGDSDGPMKIYSGLVTGADIDRIVRRHANFLTSPSMEAMVDMIIHKAEDENGEKHFTLEDKQPMLGEPFGLIAEIFGTVFSADSVEEQEKN
jgi:hypothetical protein